MRQNRRWMKLRTVAQLGFAVAATVQAGKVITVPSVEAQTISHAFIKAKPGDTVLVQKGVYRERVFIESGVALIARSPGRTILDGKGRGTVVTMGKNSTLSGFVVRNGTIGVFSKHPGNIIRNCHIVNNWQTGIICVRHLPVIEDNIIAFNRASGVQGWDARTTGSSIAHNTIAYNGNHGIAMGGGSNAVIERNILAFNERFALKLTAESEKVKATNNNIYRNLWSPKPLPAGNYSYDPEFGSPRIRMDFTVKGRLPCPECTEDQFPGVRAGSARNASSDGLF